MSIRIRKFKKEDALKVADIIKKGFLSLAPKYYSKKSVLWQIDENSPDKLLEKAKKINYFVAIENDKMLGIGGYSAEKVHTFFVRPEMQGKGIGSKIIKRCLQEAKKQNVKKLKCWATFSAEKFYSKFGFEKKRKITVRSKGDSITYIEMVVSL
jgi:N-acetylglutamate synthase-like GNAT family acetyltransferase